MRKRIAAGLFAALTATAALAQPAAAPAVSRRLDLSVTAHRAPHSVQRWSESSASVLRMSRLYAVWA